MGEGDATRSAVERSAKSTPEEFSMSVTRPSKGGGGGALQQQPTGEEGSAATRLKQSHEYFTQR